MKINSKDAEDEVKDAENLENSFNSVGFIGQDISAILESTTEEIENSIVQENSTKEDLENGIKPIEPNTPEVSENPETTMEDIENSIVDQENSTKEDLENSNVEENSIKPKVGYYGVMSSDRVQLDHIFRNTFFQILQTILPFRIFFGNFPMSFSST